MRRIGILLAAVLLCIPAVFAAPTSITCSAGAVPTIVRTEGLTETLGDIVLTCTGTPGGTVSGNLSVLLNVNVTNRVSSSTNTLDATLTADTGGGPIQGTLASPSSILFAGLNLTVSSTGTLNLRISNLRGAAGQLGTTGQPIQASLAFTGSSMISGGGFPFSVAVPNTGLLATYSTSIFCSTSPLPTTTITIGNLLATGTRFNTTRITEGFPSAFQKRAGTDMTGTRFLLSYTGFPSGSRIFVPDAIAGSDTLAPTAAGDLGGSPSGGQYAPSTSGSLLLLRVVGADANGAGGFTVAMPASLMVFDTAGEIMLSNGSGAAVYEVVDSNPNLRESAQIPTFLGISGSTNGQTAVASEQISFAPVSAVATASATDPVPRFVNTPPSSDCQTMGDCSSTYFPSLNVVAPSLKFTAQAGSQNQVQYVQVQNAKTGVMVWNASVTYASGSGWVQLSPNSGYTNGTIRIDILPQKLAAGTYQATLTINAGSAGSQNFPISLVVTPAPTPPPAPQPTVTVSGVMNAASFASGPVVPGSLATVKGANLSGKNVAVTFDATPATLLYTSDQQINLQVPSAMASKTTSQMVVTADGNSSMPQTVALAAVAPGIFVPGILNQDNSVNSANSPASIGTIVQIFATGLGTGSAITAKIGNDTISSVYYGGPAPGLTGVQQVDIAIPADLTAGPTDVQVCGATSGPPVCSPTVKIYLK